MSSTEYRVQSNRVGAIIGLVVLSVLLCLAAFGMTLQGHHPTTTHHHPKEPLKFSISKMNAPNTVGLCLGLPTFVFFAWIFIKQIRHPRQLLPANRSGITLGSGKNQHSYQWTEVKGFSVGEVIDTLPRQGGYGYRGKSRTMTALKIEFEDTANLNGLHGLDVWTSCRSPTEPNVFLINAQIFADRLEDVIQVLSRIKQ